MFPHRRLCPQDYYFKWPVKTQATDGERRPRMLMNVLISWLSEGNKRIGSPTPISIRSITKCNLNLANHLCIHSSYPF
jgi:hypothetical protein